MPILAKDKLVLSHARKVLSSARWSRATEALFSRVTDPYLSAILLYQVEPTSTLVASEDELCWDTLLVVGKGAAAAMVVADVL